MRLLTRLRRTPEPPAEPAPPPEPVDPLAAAEAAEAAALTAEAEARRNDTEGEAALRMRKRQLAAEALEHKAELARQQREREAAADALRSAEQTRTEERSATADVWAERGKRWKTIYADTAERLHRLALNAGMNGAAIYGQYRFLDERVPGLSAVALGLSVLVELMSVGLMNYAHRARLSGRRSWPLYLLSAIAACFVATLNFLHWQSDGTVLVGYMFAAFSLAAPLMWALYLVERDDRSARSAERSARSAPRSARSAPAGKRAARFAIARYIFWWTETIEAKKQAVRHGLTDPDEAIEYAAEALAERQRNAELAAARRRNEIEAAAYRLPDPLDEEEAKAMPDEAKRSAARKIARDAILAGYKITGKELGGIFHLTDKWGRNQITALKVIQLVPEHDDTADDIADLDAAGEGK